MTIDHTKHSSAHRDRKTMMDREEVISMEAEAPDNKSAALGKPMVFLHRETAKEEIAKRAYQIWQERSEPIGQNLEHWLLAESELSGRHLHQN